MYDTEMRSECPICGHSAVLLIDPYIQAREISCPDRYCPNNREKNKDE